MLTPCLGQGEVGQCREVLVEGHVVVDILVAGDARQRPAVEALGHRQAVHHAGAAVEAGVVICYFPRLHPLVGVTALAAQRGAQCVAQREGGRGLPHEFHSS